MCSTRDYIRRYWNNNLPTSVNSNGVQQIRIPTTGYYRFTAYGAMGGNQGDQGALSVAPFIGGKGATVSAIYYLKTGDLINMAIGQSGTSRFGCCSAPMDLAGGGGGGSFVWIEGRDKVPLVVAGGGGGVSSSTTAPNQPYCFNGAAFEDVRFLNSLCVQTLTTLQAPLAGTTGLGGQFVSGNPVSWGGPGAGWSGNGSFVSPNLVSNYTGLSFPFFWGGRTIASGATLGHYSGEINLKNLSFVVLL